MIRVVCNGCRQEINREDRARSDELAKGWLKSKGAYGEQGVVMDASLVAVLSTDGDQDLFCHKCISKAQAYWDEKAFKLEAWMTQYKAQIRNHQKDFFSKKNGQPAAITHDNPAVPRLH
jgi:hypothetical protein